MTKKFISIGFEVQFDGTRNLEFYGFNLITDYKDLIQGFFTFYGHFDYKQKVISTFTGQALDVDDYKQLYPNFNLQGLYIAGPCNKGKNWGVDCSPYESNFISLCEDSSKFFDSL